MTKGCIMVGVRTIQPLEDRLNMLEEVNMTFKTFSPGAMDYGHKQMLKYANKIGANVVAIADEFLLADLREYSVKATFYRLYE